MDLIEEQEMGTMLNNLENDGATNETSKESSKKVACSVEDKNERNNDKTLAVARHDLRQKREKNLPVKLADLWKPIDPFLESPAKRPLRIGRLRRPAACLCHCSKPQSERRKARVKNVSSRETKNKASKLPSVESVISSSVVGFLQYGLGSKKKIDPALLQHLAKEDPLRTASINDKKAKELVANGQIRSLEDGRDRVEEQLQQQQMVDDYADAEDSEDHLENSDDGFPVLLPDFEDVPLDNYKSNHDVTFGEPGNDYEALVQKWVAGYVSNAQELIASSDLTLRVNRWKELIAPRIEEEENRHAFDIHSYGTKVLNCFSNDLRKQTLKFESVVAGEEPREVARIFLSCLMLANTYNIQLSTTSEEELPMDCLELTLLSRVRHHEELEEYAAPSQFSTSPIRKSEKQKRKVNLNMR